MNRSMPGLPVHHQLPEFTQTHALSQWCHLASHPLSSPSPPALNLSQHRGLFKWVSSSHQVAKVLEFQFQHQEYVRVFQSPYDHLTPKLTFSAYSFSYSVKTFVNVLHPPLASSEVFITRSNNDRLDWGLQGTANNQIMNFVWEWSSGKKRKKKKTSCPIFAPSSDQEYNLLFFKAASYLGPKVDLG